MDYSPGSAPGGNVRIGSDHGETILFPSFVVPTKNVE